MSSTHRYCPVCNYSAPPERIKTERKHFDGHSLECSRCGYRTETTGSFSSASRLWDERGAQTGAHKRPVGASTSELDL